MKNFLRVGLIIVTLTFVQKGNAQLKGFSIGPYAEIGWPVSDFSRTHNYGLGAGFGADIKLPGRLGLTGSIGYMQFNGKEVNTSEGSFKAPPVKAFPIRAGLKFRALPLLFMKLEGGVANYNGDNGAAFIASPGIGIRVLNFEFQGKYEAWIKSGNTQAFWGLKAGINF